VENWKRPVARLAATRFDFVHALRAGSAADLETASASFEALGAMLYAAEAAAAAARAARKSGATKQVVRLDALTSRLLNFCGPVATPLLAGRRGGVLSTREGEVARLAARGLTNRQIAQRLVVSERTVENHLYRIFTKLGVDARDKIAGAIPLD
jgi:DNA-binding NarL/FixJ family response regulator